MRSLLVVLLCLAAPIVAGAKPPAPMCEGLKTPESAVVGVDGRVYVTAIGEFDKAGDGAVMVLEDGKAVPFATGLDDPKGIAVFLESLFVADKDKVWRIDPTGKAELFVPPNAFPSTPKFLNDLAADPESGMLYVSDSGDLQGHGGAVYRITPRGLVDVLTDARRWPDLHTPNGLALEGASHLLVADFGTGFLHRIKLATGATEKLAEGLGGADGLIFDRHGRLFISDWTGGRVLVIPRPGDQPIEVAAGFQSAADLCLAPSGNAILVPDMKAGTLTELPAQTPGAEVDETPLPLKAVAAFPEIEWTGWKGETEEGTLVPHRPIVLTHPGDGTHRIVVATQQGVIHVLPSGDGSGPTEVFLDLQDRVRYDDKMNEEGFLGLAFHPQFKKNGELFVFYTPQKSKHPHTNLVSRFRVSKDDPKRADPASEQVVLRIEHPYWNHDGGTIAFGPDGFLYVTLGDGGAANDPFGNGQNLDTLLGKVLRIDVDHKDKGKAYAIPKDNPLRGQAGARPEIWAYGLRNVWRFSFDRKTGKCWAGDVGQNLWEEIDLLVPGGNFGWNVREGLHPFGPRGTGPRKELLDPIWEYHHDSGKSITGGFVYRGEKLPELKGAYLYADYVKGEVRALRYDDEKGRVIADRLVPGPSFPVLSFGEDEAGEVYFLTATNDGQGIFRFEKASE